MNDGPAQVEKENPATEEVIEKTPGETAFTLEELQKHWGAFAEKKKMEGKDSAYNLLQHDKRLEENKIIISLSNAVQIDLLDHFRSDLVNFLRHQLDNRRIDLEIEIPKEESKKMIYTNKEKYEYLVEKKPLLNELKNRLGLDTDF